jgi:hypothetical protein
MSIGTEQGGPSVRRETRLVMNAMNISILVLCIVIAGGIYWGGFAEERRATKPD